VVGREQAGRERLREAFASEPAFSAWYGEVLPRLYGYLFVRCGRDPDLAEDLTQVTFIEAIRSRETFDGRADPVTWLCGIARHKLADHFRRSQRDEDRGRRLAAAHRHEPPDEAAAVGEREAIGRALATLPALQRAVLVFTALDGLTVAEAAALIDRSESATESLLHRARVGFREAYGREEGNDV
jgi:RNA polymerase sigma-70 factor, ECF subfamily